MVLRQNLEDPLLVADSMYHVGIQVARWGQSQELGVLTQAMYSGREAAMQRMVAEAASVGADGVVGVRLDLVMYQGGHEVMEFMAVGTAVRSVTHPGEYRAPNGQPFTSDLSGATWSGCWRSAGNEKSNPE